MIRSGHPCGGVPFGVNLLMRPQTRTNAGAGITLIDDALLLTQLCVGSDGAQAPTFACTVRYSGQYDEWQRLLECSISESLGVNEWRDKDTCSGE